MEIKGFGSFSDVEHRLATLSADEKNELYLSGELDRMLDDVEQGLNYSKKQRRRGDELQ